MKKFLSGSLRQKLLTPTTVVLALAIVSLSTVLVTVQQRQLAELSNSLLESIVRITADTGNSLGVMEKEVNSYLEQMSLTAGETLAASTQKALEAEQAVIASDLEKVLRQNAESTADLLAQVAPGAILSNNFIDLIAYAKSATRNADIVYAIYMQPNGKPMTRYLDKQHTIIQEYIKTGEGKNKILKVIDGSKKDDSVFLVEKPVQLEGKMLGSVLLCIDRSSINRKVGQMSHRFAAVIKNNSQQINLVLNSESEKITRQMRQMLEDLSAKNSTAAGAIADSIQASGREVKSRTQLISTAVGGGAILIVFLILFFILTRISNAIRQMVNDLNQGAEKVARSANQISSASHSLAEGSSEQAASIEETSSSLEEMSSMTKQNAGNANQADALMKDASRVVVDASASMTLLTQAMQDISNASEETSKIIKTIDEIAFQTNLLALNAAVEAARAGEAGAGFAVVADEVRNLALRAADAAKNTANLIEGTVVKVHEGGNLVEQTNSAFSKVTDGTAKVAELLGEIAAASNEQAQGIEQVNTAVMEMDRVTQRNAANSEETAASSQEMGVQSQQMKAMVGGLLALVGGQAKTPSATDNEADGDIENNAILDS